MNSNRTRTLFSRLGSWLLPSEVVQSYFCVFTRSPGFDRRWLPSWFGYSLDQTLEHAGIPLACRHARLVVMRCACRLWELRFEVRLADGVASRWHVCFPFGGHGLLRNGPNLVSLFCGGSVHGSGRRDHRRRGGLHRLRQPVRKPANSAGKQRHRRDRRWQPADQVVHRFQRARCKWNADS